MSRNNKKIVRTVTAAMSIDFFKDIMFKMKNDGFETVIITSPDPFLDNFRNNYPEYKCVEVPMERHISPIKDFVSLIRMVYVFAKEKPYVVHSMTPKAGLLSQIAGLFTGVPIRIHTFTGLVWPTSTGVKRKLLILTDKILCACATHIIPEGIGVMNDLQTHITKKPMKVLGYGNVMGIDMTKFSRRTEILKCAEILRKQNLFTFIFTGRIVGDKGINELVEAFCKLKLVIPYIRLVLVGSIEDNDPVSNVTMEAIRTSKGIEFVGTKFGDELISYYAAADCLVLPSYREGFPNTVLEGGAMGLPSIVTDINGSREIIYNGVNGIIVPPRDTDSLFNAMKCIVESKELYTKLASNSRTMIESRFEKSFVQGCLLNYYKEIIR